MGVKIEVSGATYTGNLKSLLMAKTNSQSYITTTGISDVNQQNAIKKLMNELAVTGIYSKLKSLWLFVGDSHDKIKLNLISQTQNTLATVPIGNISGGLSLVGLNGVDTNFLGDASFVQNGHIAFYNSSPETNVITIPINEINGDTAMTNTSLSRSIGSDGRIGFGLKGITVSPSIINKERGLFVGTHSNNLSSIYSRGVFLESYAKTNTGINTINMSIGTNSQYKSSMKLQLVSAGSSLTASEVLAYSNACEVFMNDLAR